jgi:glycosyltransferase involved in cell wall biosynthesis
VTAAPDFGLSVVIATHNRRELLRRCLESLSAQTQDPATFEVIVADDGSSDGSAEMAEAFGAPYRLRVLRLPKGGKSAALNAAIEQAAGLACLFIDDDVIASPALVAEHAAAHREEPKVLAIGKLTQPPPESGDWFAIAHAEAWNERYETLAGKRVDWPDTYGGNFSAPREPLLAAGGFDAELPAVEDIELGYRLCEAGCRVRYLPGAEGVHDDEEKPRRKVLADVRGFGGFCAEFSARWPAARAKLLGWFLDTTPREVMLRRLFLTLRLPPRMLAMLGAAIPGQGRKGVWFGFVSRYAFWLGARSAMSRGAWLETTRGVPVLMYHGFTDSGERDRYVIPSRSFRRQMRILAALGRKAISFEELARSLRKGVPLPRRAVVITIDDGYRDNFELAFPILRRQRIPATIFLVSRKLGGSNDWGDEGAVADRPILAAEQVEAMAAEGVGFGAHTRSHPRLPELGDDAVSEEIAGSKDDLEGLLGEAVETFAYPYGRFDERAVTACEQAGFAAACTTENRHAHIGDAPMLIPRIEIRGSDSLPRFLRKLWFAGD